jgi:hypothetical protein
VLFAGSVRIGLAAALTTSQALWCGSRTGPEHVVEHAATVPTIRLIPREDTVFRRVARITFKLGIIAAVAVGVAVVVKKLTAPPPPPASLEPWPPLAGDTPATESTSTGAEGSNGEAATTSEETAPSSN